MDLNEIREYAELMREYGLTALEIGENGALRLERAQTFPQVSAPAAADSEQEEQSAMSSAARGLTEVTSPMVGVFYKAPAENADPYVQVGDRVKSGDVLCIIEAMKLMNEITAEEDGIIEEVCVLDGDVVDYGTVLFRMSRA